MLSWSTPTCHFRHMGGASAAHWQEHIGVTVGLTGALLLVCYTFLYALNIMDSIQSNTFMNGRDFYEHKKCTTHTKGLMWAEGALCVMQNAAFEKNAPATLSLHSQNVVPLMEVLCWMQPNGCTELKSKPLPTLILHSRWYESLVQCGGCTVGCWWNT